MVVYITKMASSIMIIPGWVQDYADHELAFRGVSPRAFKNP